MFDDIDLEQPFKFLPVAGAAQRDAIAKLFAKRSIVQDIYGTPSPVLNFVSPNAPSTAGVQHYHQTVNGCASCVAFKFNNGVVMSADTLVSYGTMSRFTSVDRVFKLADRIMLGCSGEFSDFQYLQRNYAPWFMQKIFYNEIPYPEQFFKHITGLLYKERCKMRRLNINVIIGGITRACEAFLGRIDTRGTPTRAEACCTGMGQYLAMPLIKERFMQKHKPPINRKEAIKLIDTCMMVLHYRDCLAIRKYKMAICTPKGVEIIGPIKCHEDWSIAKGVIGYN
ncbi:proteasome subunit beta type-4-like [Teleopsis dalmanni]|uniref:proteasome subunit beta type-4-like n=1 Tax=Teleopsis dalmanni TaxID=139649 RepID=UPI0018CE1D10|nr:proteasome subunit beta type-4-like [Teleopsis dalmanni]